MMNIGKLAREFLCTALATVFATGAIATTCSVNVASDKQTIDGFGFSSAWSGALSDAKNAALYDTLGMSLLRIRIDPYKNWANETANAAAAHSRGLLVLGTPWTPPPAMKSNNSDVGGVLRTDQYAAYADYLKEAADSIGLDYVSFQNEPDITVTYESCDWTPGEMETFTRENAAVIGRPVVMPESFNFKDSYADPTLNDPLAAENMAVVGGHIYGNGLFPHPNAAAKGKRLWQTEHYVDQTQTSITNCMKIAREIGDCMNADMNAYFWWWVTDTDTSVNLVNTAGTIFKNGYTIGQYAKWIRPGSVRVSADYNPAASVYVTAYKKDATLVIVAVNQGTSPVDQVFALQGAVASSVTPWTTSATQDMEMQSAVPVTGGSFTATLPADSITTFVGDLTFPAPAIVTSPVDRTVATGKTVVMDVTASGEMMTHQWKKDGVDIPGATSRILVIRNAQASDAGAYSVTVSNNGGSATSAPGSVTVVNTANPGRLINISTRSSVGTGDNVQIGGFVIVGSQPMQVLIRASGPAISGAVTGTLSDPSIELHDQATNTIIDSNDNWDPSLAPVFTQAGAFPWTEGSKDAAIVTTLNPGGYTAVVRGADGGTGVALVEIYALSGGSGSRLVNISTRSPVETGDKVQIGGFVIGGTTSKAVVIRASGPALHELVGMKGYLPDPVIELHDQATNTIIASSDNWEDGLEAQFAAVGAFPWSAGSKDAAMVLSLNPGPYTVVVRGRNNLTGVGLVEIYDLP